MKKFLCLFLSTTFLLLLCGCSKISTSRTTFKQEATIVIMPSPPKCKTTDVVNEVNEIIDILGEIEKAPNTCANTNGWSIMIKIDIDGENFTYTIADDCFTDSDGTQYGITNYDYIEEKIMSIYGKIEAPEVDYQ